MDFRPWPVQRMQTPVLGRSIHPEDRQHVAWGGGSRVWIPSVDVSVTAKFKFVNPKVSREFLLPKTSPLALDH